MTGVTGKTGAEFSVTAVTTVTEAPVQPFEALCAAFYRQAGEVPVNGEIGHVQPLWAKPPETASLEKERPGHRDGKRPIFRWGQHRVCLDMGRSPSPANRILRAEARTHF